VPESHRSSPAIFTAREAIEMARTLPPFSARSRRLVLGNGKLSTSYLLLPPHHADLFPLPDLSDDCMRRPEIHWGPLQAPDFAAAVTATKDRQRLSRLRETQFKSIFLSGIPRVMESIAILASLEREEDQDHSMTRWAHCSPPKKADSVDKFIGKSGRQARKITSAGSTSRRFCSRA